jgi:hypothetical protein
MKKETRRLLGSIALVATTLGTFTLLGKRKSLGKAPPANRWARPGMMVTFRAELMPGRDGSERTYRVLELLPSERVLLEGVAGEHARTEFERVR